MRYSFYTAGGDSIFIYFNECNYSVPNIKATRDSLGNLILRFGVEDLLDVEDYLNSDELNTARVVIVMNDGSEYEGIGEVFINDKKAP